MMNRSFYILLSLSFLVIANVSAQVHNEGLPIAITSGLNVSIGSDFTSTGPITNDGIVLMEDSVKNIDLSGTYSGAGILHFTGNNQNIKIADTVQYITMESGDKVLTGSLSVLDLTLNNSKVIGNNQNLILLGNLTGYDSLHFIEGRLVRTGSDSLTFPIGKGGKYTPVTLTNISGVSPAISVESFEADPLGTPGYGLLAVSANRYWRINTFSGTLSSANVELPVINESVAPDMTQMSMAFSTAGGTFSGLGQVSSSGDLISGSLTASSSAGPGYYTFGRFFDESLRVADSTALVNIYQNTGGTGWSNAAGWLSGKLDTWTGITLVDKRVSEVTIPNNNLTGDLPGITSGLEQLTRLDVSANELSTIGDVSLLSALQNLDVSNNLMQFGTLENLISSFPSAIYTPQKEALEKIRVVQEIGSSYGMDRTVTGTANTYAWFKDGTSISEVNPTFSISVPDFSVDGVYHAEVTNSIVTGLTLRTTPIVLRVSSLERDSTSLRIIYDSLVTASSTVSDWTSLPMSQWTEITISNSRVTNLNLAGKVLEGPLPEEIMDLQELASVDLSNNKISGLPAIGSNMPKVTSFNVSQNALQFDALEPNVGLAGINYDSQAKVGSPSNEILPVGSSYSLSQSVRGTSNLYQWVFTATSGAVTDQAVAGGDSSDYTVPSLDYSTMGTYVLNVTNSTVPGLTIQSEPAEILASANLGFIGFGKNDAKITTGNGHALKVSGLPGVPFDTVAVIQPTNGDFVFQDLILGNYLIAFESDTAIYVPTYFKNTDLWTKADTLRLRADRSDTLRMTFKPDPFDPNQGDGVVKGFVESNFSNEVDPSGRVQARRKVKKAGCSLRRRTTSGGGRTNQEDEFVLVAYVETNDEGQFEFQSIPSGFYRFNIEYPGIPMDPSSFVEFSIGEDGIENNTFTLEAYVTEEGIEVIKIEELGFYRKYFKDLNVYPNPADVEVNLSYSKLLSNTIWLNLVDLSGHVFIEKHVESGYHQVDKLDISKVPSGMYFLTFEDRASGGAKRVASYKIYINH